MQWTVDDDTSLFVESEKDTSATVRGLALGGDRLVMVPHARSLGRIIAPHTQRPLDSDPGWNTLATWLENRRSDQTAFESLLRLEQTAEASYVAAINPGEPTAKSDTAQDESPPNITADWVAAQIASPLSAVAGRC